MPSVVDAVPRLQASTCAILRLVKRVKQRGKKKPPAIEITLAFVGTAWCIVPDRYVVTAHHILNDGKPRDPHDRFYAFTVPANAAAAYHYPVAALALEDQATDLAILELGPCPTPGQHLASLPVTFHHPPDGTLVATYGFPSPVIEGANVDANAGTFLGGGRFFLKGHANEGIVAAQYEVDGVRYYEFNVGWHHGESGGPAALLDPLAVLAVMQHYRNIKTPHGVVAGPHRGRAIEAIQQQLRQLGAAVL